MTAIGLSQPRTGTHILLVVDSLDVGGAERHVVGLSGALVQRGYDVTIACSTGGALVPSAKLAGIVVSPLGPRLVKRRVGLRYSRGLARLLRERPVDLVHAHLYASASAATLATLGCGVPVVITEHSEAGWRSRWARWWSSLLYRRAAHVIAVSDAIAQRLVEGDRVAADRVSVIPNALLPPIAPPGHILQLAGNGRVTGPRVGVVARLQPEKGVAILIRAAAAVVTRALDAHFLIIGDGPQQDALVALTAQLGLQRRVHFLGFRLDAASLISTFDVLAVPSLSEGTPLVILEAMGAGVPVVASNVGGIPQLIRHGREGLLVPPADASALAGALSALLTDPTLAGRLGRAGQQRCVQRYSLATMVSQTVAVYDRVIGQAPAPPAVSVDRAERLVS